MTPASIRKAQRLLRERDPALGRVIDAVGPYRLVVETPPDLYEPLARAIVFQQLSGKAAGTIFGRVRALGASGFPTPAEIAVLPDDVLRGAGLSRNKLLAIRDLAAFHARGALPTVEQAAQLDDEVLIAQLTQVRGIGVWTVQMLLMFRLGRPDVLPSADLGIQKGLQKALRKRTPLTAKDVIARGARWAPHRTMACWYLWRSLDGEAAL